MKKLITIILAFAVVLALAAPAQATRHNTVPCWEVNNGSYGGVLRDKPRVCVMGGKHGYEQVSLANIQWRSFGGLTTYGKGTFRENMGFRCRARFKVYRPRLWEAGSYYFTRIKIRVFLKGPDHVTTLKLRYY